MISYRDTESLLLILIISNSNISSKQYIIFAVSDTFIIFFP
jgi:hypothetical protein